MTYIYSFLLTSLVFFILFYLLRPSFLGTYMTPASLLISLVIISLKRPILSSLIFFYLFLVVLVFFCILSVAWFFDYPNFFIENTFKYFGTCVIALLLFSSISNRTLKQQIMCLNLIIFLASLPVLFGFTFYNLFKVSPAVMAVFSRREAYEVGFFYQMEFAFPGTFINRYPGSEIIRFCGLFPEPGLYQLLPAWAAGLNFLIFKKDYWGYFFTICSLASLSTNSFVCIFFLFCIRFFARTTNVNQNLISICFLLGAMYLSLVSDLGFYGKLESRHNLVSVTTREEVMYEGINSILEKPFGSFYNYAEDQGINLIGSLSYLGVFPLVLALSPFLFFAGDLPRLFNLFCVSLPALITALFFQPIFFTPCFYLIFIVSSFFILNFPSQIIFKKINKNISF